MNTHDSPERGSTGPARPDGPDPDVRPEPPETLRPGPDDAAEEDREDRDDEREDGRPDGPAGDTTPQPPAADHRAP